ncbi:SigE family RNA polymerase sigma factor [Actinoplanes sichuanensis]|uniref:SigE family RNA polymerase sigma factor n=1 Tax=Actinoplanes sichuanensis TaxID=512349 RepID=A0ABW4ANY5_9ACTN|nr:SigE family RNA polymerase sigma factor [Actinoplanes sichuanensis]BEL06679.1 SigE family RNA polymerase sigma factor [Actinoplanes sichuanensis]
MNSDEEANYRSFVDAQAHALRRLAYLTCGDWQLAEDAVFTALAKLYDRWRRVDRPESYARSMVVRAAIDEVRRPWWRREHPAGHAIPEQVGADTAPDVDERLRIRAALAQLPARRRAVLVLRYFEGLSVQETAEALNCPEATVKSHTVRGLRTLRDVLGVDADLSADDSNGMERYASRHA